VEALAAGRRAAGTIHRFLSGERRQAVKKQEKTFNELLGFSGSCLDQKPPPPLPERPLKQRRIDREDVKGLEPAVAREEAERCFNCGCVAVNASDMAPVLIVLDAMIKTTKRTLSAEDLFSCGADRPDILDSGEILTEIFIPRPSETMQLSYEKFRIRKTVDFPILSLASAYDMTAGKMKNVRLVLGAAAPVPLRLTETERFLKGKKPGKGVAEQAAAIAAEKAIPLSGNAFKIQIMKTLLRRSILAAGKR
jgi:CO/xanthine dehydrogenase FAD-binding subunit